MTIANLSRYGTLASLLLAALAGSPATAQELQLSTDPVEQARAAMARNDPAEALSRYLRALAIRPRDMESLLGAGRAALEIGDPNAAIGFFARAEEIEPRNGQVKAGLGSAMLQMENAKAALRLFNEATDLGVPPGEIAGDRGLAYDLRGDNRRAQQDYILALRNREVGEIRRRLALSLAMTGDRAGALAILDPLLRKQDVPAWRTRAFVLALIGDMQGAEGVALKVMPKPQVEALLPFLARLRGLKPQQQAAAVHFGHFPSDGRRYTEAELFASAPVTERPEASRPGAGLIPSGAPLGSGGSASPTAADELASKAPRRRPGSIDEKTPAKPPAAPRPGESARMLEIAAVLRSLPAQSTAAPPAPAEKPMPAAPERKAAPEPGLTSFPGNLARTRLAQAEPSISAKPKAETKIEAKPAAPGAKDAKSKGETAEKGKDAKPKDSGKPKQETKADAKGKSAPERYWVQVAGGANKGDLPKAYAKLKEKSPKLFAGRSAWTAPLRATNRLLVGPFKTLGEAQAFVNQAGKESVSAFAYTSPAGQDVEKLAVK